MGTSSLIRQAARARRDLRRIYNSLADSLLVLRVEDQVTETALEQHVSRSSSTSHYTDGDAHTLQRSRSAEARPEVLEVDCHDETTADAPSASRQHCAVAKACTVSGDAHGPQVVEIDCDDGVSDAPSSSGHYAYGKVTAFTAVGDAIGLQVVEIDSDDVLPDARVVGSRTWTVSMGERRMYNRVMLLREEIQAVLLNHRFGWSLRRRDLQRLKGGRWLNDEFMNYYIAGLLMDRDERWRSINIGAPKCHFFSSFFMKALYMNKHGYKYKKVQRWTSSKRLQRVGQSSTCILQVERILIPVNINNTHWMCVMIDLKAKQVVALDSFGEQHSELLETVARYIQDEAKDKLKEDWDMSDWKLCSMTAPRQTNGYDCGVFVCQYLERLSAGLPWDFTQADMTANGRIKLMCQALAHHVN